LGINLRHDLLQALAISYLLKTIGGQEMKPETFLTAQRRRSALRLLCTSGPRLWKWMCRRRLGPPPRRHSKAASSRRSPRRFAHFHLNWRAPGSSEFTVRRIL